MPFRWQESLSLVQSVLSLLETSRDSRRVNRLSYSIHSSSPHLDYLSLRPIKFPAETNLFRQTIIKSNMPKVRCRYYTNEGHPIGGGCRLLGIGCDYVHPSEAAWSSARPCKQSTNPYPHPHPPRARNQQDASIEDLAYKSPSPWGGGGVSAGRPAWSSGGVGRVGVGAGTGANTVAVQPKQRTTNDSSGKWGDSSAWADPTPSSFVGGWGGNSPPRGNTTVGGWGGATPERTNTSAWGGAAPEGEFTGWASPKGGGWGSAWGTTSSDKDKPAAEPIATSNSGVLGSSIPWDATPSSDKNKPTQAPTFASSSNGGWGDGGGGRWGDAQSVPSSKKPAEKEKDVASDRAGWGGGGWGRGEPTEAVSSTALPPPSTSLKNATSMTPTVQESTSAGSVRQPEPRPDKGKGKATDEDFNAWQVGSSPTRKLANADHSMGMDMDISDAGSSHANE
ncbi:hypothetical protein C8Q75DRAFT_13756 [Abortiporus biennis]|nr:hypothetical protein C8Q75DRAFT_13756 [Abortiporus biennis]